MKDLRLFGTEAWPIHPSGIRNILLCPWRAVLRYIEEPEDLAGPAADTGSAVHAAVAAFHRGKGAGDALEEMHARAAKYPQANLQEAAHMFLAYAFDSRNDVEVVLVEAPIKFSIAPLPEDETKAPIEVVGTVDQVRRVAGRLSVHDVKTSKMDALDLMNNHTHQMAAYCVGASYVLNEPVHPGSLILTRKYRADGTGPAHYPYNWTLADVDRVLFQLRLQVSLIRRGVLYHFPGDHCKWCHKRTPDLCFPLLKEYDQTSR